MGRYVLVTGGQLFNKGAQAMSFITVDEIAKRFPDSKVVLLSQRDARRSATEKANYRFEILPFPRLRYCFLSHTGIGRWILSRNSNPVLKRDQEIISNADAMIDISGYSLSSDWDCRNAFNYLVRIAVAKWNHIPVFLMPQSFGPFDFTGKYAPLVRFMIRHYLPYAKCIMAREEEGYHLLHDRFHLRNVWTSLDLVLLNKGIDKNNIYVNVPAAELDIIPDHSVGIIPNQKTTVHGDKQATLAQYSRIIRALLDRGKKVTLLYHSTEDFALCKEIKTDYYAKDENVVVVSHELSCLEYDAIVSKFEFVVASRYHSIVIAYKNAVPALVLGWATKYRELLQLFSQERFCFDVRKEMDGDEILGALHFLCDHTAEESRKLSISLAKLQTNNPFDVLNCLQNAEEA